MIGRLVHISLVSFCRFFCFVLNHNVDIRFRFWKTRTHTIDWQATRDDACFCFSHVVQSCCCCSPKSAELCSSGFQSCFALFVACWFAWMAFVLVAVGVLELLDATNAN